MSVDAYLQARADFVAVDEAVTAAARLIDKVGKNLTDFRQAFHFSNTGFERPAEMVLGHAAISFDGRSWPTATAIMEKLAAWHETRRACAKAWSALSKEQQDSVEPPPRGVLGPY